MGGQKQKKQEIQAERTEFAQFCATAFGELWYLLKLNLLFLTACIPIVTVPMAVTAGLRITSSLAAGKQPPLWRAFCSAFFGEWKRALACGWALTLLQALAGFGVSAYAVMMDANPLALLPLIAAALIFAALFSFSLYFYSMLAMCRLSLQDMLRNALILAVSERWRNLVATLAAVLCGGASVLFFPVTLPLAIFLLPALALLAASCAIRPGLKRCMREDENTPGGAGAEPQEGR